MFANMPRFYVLAIDIHMLYTVYTHKATDSVCGVEISYLSAKLICFLKPNNNKVISQLISQRFIKLYTH